MTRAMRWLIVLGLGIGVAYLLFYLGGVYSFRYTHVCTRSHQQLVFQATQNNAVPHTITVCDHYSGNTKRWSPGDPVRALYSEPLAGWNAAIVVGIVLLIAAAMLYVRRRQWAPRIQPHVSRAGREASDQAVRLLAFRNRTWSPFGDGWEDGYAALAEFADRVGHTRVPATYVQDGYELGAWVIQQRNAYRHRQLAKERIARLEALPGWVWTATSKPRTVKEGA